MPYKDPSAARLANRERQRRWRARQKAQKAAAAASSIAAAKLPADPIGALAQWSRETLRVPPGHPLAGQPLALPDYGEAFLRDALTARESLLCIARKSAKSAIVGRVPARSPCRSDRVRRIPGRCGVGEQREGR